MAVVSLDAKVAFLRKSASYPDHPDGVRAIETHMSWVFLAGRHAYKLKKPVLFPFLDFSTIEKRRHFCDEEIRLNRRLAPRIYIETVPLTADAHGALTLGGSGEAADWLVKMHRIPQHRMLDHAIRSGSYTRAEIAGVAHVLAGFYASAPPGALTAAQYLERFESDIVENRRELCGVPSLLEPDAVRRIHQAQMGFVRDESRLLAQRVRNGRIVEGHGDLRPEHVALDGTPQIIDRLEFNRAFRTLDALDELAYFALECEMLDAGAVGAMLLDGYCSQTGDAAPAVLLDFYKCYRASLRAKLCVWHLRESDSRGEHWRKRARAYFTAAAVYAGRLCEAQFSVSATSESPA